jgi:hypothetical protein
MGRYGAPSHGDGAAPISGANVASFRLGPIPVRIEFPFFLVAVLLGLNTHKDVMLLVAWVVVVFVSILVHELGHAIVGRAFGSETSIVLHGMGGLTFRGGGRYSSATEDILVSLAGSLTQMAILGFPALVVVRSSSITSYRWYLSSRIALEGTNEGRTSPCSTSSAIHEASATSVFRPGTFFRCWAFRSQHSKSSSSR